MLCPQTLPQFSRFLSQAGQTATICPAENAIVFQNTACQNSRGSFRLNFDLTEV
jgi:hypothetical protein